MIDRQGYTAKLQHKKGEYQSIQVQQVINKGNNSLKLLK